MFGDDSAGYAVLWYRFADEGANPLYGRRVEIVAFGVAYIAAGGEYFVDGSEFSFTLPTKATNQQEI